MLSIYLYWIKGILRGYAIRSGRRPSGSQRRPLTSLGTSTWPYRVTTQYSYYTHVNHPCMVACLDTLQYFNIICCNDDEYTWTHDISERSFFHKIGDIGIYVSLDEGYLVFNVGLVDFTPHHIYFRILIDLTQLPNLCARQDIDISKTNDTVIITITQVIIYIYIWPYVYNC